MSHRCVIDALSPSTAPIGDPPPPPPRRRAERRALVPPSGREQKQTHTTRGVFCSVWHRGNNLRLFAVRGAESISVLTCLLLTSSSLRATSDYFLTGCMIHTKPFCYFFLLCYFGDRQKYILKYIFIFWTHVVLFSVKTTRTSTNVKEKSFIGVKCPFNFIIYHKWGPNWSESESPATS